MRLDHLVQKTVECPHCGHHFPLEFDPSNGSQSYYEGCPACCEEMHLVIDVDENSDQIQLSIDGDDEQIF